MKHLVINSTPSPHLRCSLGLLELPTAPQQTWQKSPLELQFSKEDLCPHGEEVYPLLEDPMIVTMSLLSKFPSSPWLPGNSEPGSCSVTTIIGLICPFLSFKFNSYFCFPFYSCLFVSFL